MRINQFGLLQPPVTGYPTIIMIIHDKLIKAKRNMYEFLELNYT